MLCAGCATTTNVADNIEQQSIVIGTGGAKGMYFPTGKAICKIVNLRKRSHGVSCNARNTKGSVDNLKAIELGDLQFAIAKSDRIFQAYRGLANWKDKPILSLRTIFSIHSESIHLVANSSFNTIHDLREKKVNIGTLGSSQRMDSLDALNAHDIKLEDLDGSGLKSNDALKLFKNGQLDAFFYTVGDPNGVTNDAIDARKANIIPVDGLGVDELITRYPFYEKTVIPGRWYPMMSNKGDIPTFGYKTILFTSAEAPEEVVYRITKEIFNNLYGFINQHPAFEELTKHNMVNILDKLAPIHPGALRYYKEVGLK